jgi:hypothetical protein
MELSHRLEFINASTDLNFEINNCNWIPITENVILMDFMETFDVADIFIIQSEGI